ncbi:hypothetical protein VTJ83DRAFT_6957 [Remersonia thermophila]|uniref:Transmembrane protein n=1 Tax=Remersonia thermophila TaxID=72144 RepID=A0ABR4D6F1_9PEZI
MSVGRRSLPLFLVFLRGFLALVSFGILALGPGFACSWQSGIRLLLQERQRTRRRGGIGALRDKQTIVRSGGLRYHGELLRRHDHINRARQGCRVQDQSSADRFGEAVRVPAVDVEPGTNELRYEGLASGFDEHAKNPVAPSHELGVVARPFRDVIGISRDQFHALKVIEIESCEDRRDIQRRVRRWDGSTVTVEALQQLAVPELRCGWPRSIQGHVLDVVEEGRRAWAAALADLVEVDDQCCHAYHLRIGGILGVGLDLVGRVEACGAELHAGRRRDRPIEDPGVHRVTLLCHVFGLVKQPRGLLQASREEDAERGSFRGPGGILLDMPQSFNLSYKTPSSRQFGPCQQQSGLLWGPALKMLTTEGVVAKVADLADQRHRAEDKEGPGREVAGRKPGLAKERDPRAHIRHYGSPFNLRKERRQHILHLRRRSQQACELTVLKPSKRCQTSTGARSRKCVSCWGRGWKVLAMVAAAVVVFMVCLGERNALSGVEKERGRRKQSGIRQRYLGQVVGSPVPFAVCRRVTLVRIRVKPRSCRPVAPAAMRAPARLLVLRWAGAEH